MLRDKRANIIHHTWLKRLNYLFQVPGMHPLVAAAGCLFPEFYFPSLWIYDYVSLFFSLFLFSPWSLEPLIPFSLILSRLSFAWFGGHRSQTHAEQLHERGRRSVVVGTRDSRNVAITYICVSRALTVVRSGTSCRSVEIQGSCRTFPLLKAEAVNCMICMMVRWEYCMIALYYDYD